MSQLRIVLATRRFWPHVDGPTVAMMRLAAGLTELGDAVTVLTADPETTRPAEFFLEKVRVLRLARGAYPWWERLRHLFDLVDWLRQHRNEYDVASVSGLGYDAYAAQFALQPLNKPLVLRAEAGGTHGDGAWQTTARFGRRVRARCQQASAVVAASAAIAEELVDAGYDEHRITVIANPAPACPPRSADLLSAARANLRFAHASLLAPDIAPVALYIGRIDATDWLPLLLGSWRLVVDRLPNARLWLIGSGRAADAVLRLAERFGLEMNVSVVGPFDDVTEFYQAADVFVLPYDCGGESLAATEAMTAGLPVVAVESPGNRKLLADGERGWLVAWQDREMADRLLRALGGDAEMRSLAAEIRPRVLHEHDPLSAARLHHDLFCRVVQSSLGPSK